MTDADICDILRHYPGCPAAIAWLELFVCAPVEGSPESVWQLLMTVTQNPTDMVRELQELIDTELAEPEYQYQSALASKLPTIRAEMEHPDFTTYIAGKMGCV